MSERAILIIDDSELIAMMLSTIVAELGYEATSAHSIAEAIAAIDASPPAAVITDWHLPDCDDPIARLRAHPELGERPIVLISGAPQAELDALAEERGADAAISKDAGLPGMSAALGPLLTRLLA